MLEAKNLTKSIDGKSILRDVSFVLDPGTITGLVGRNGAGKTTLLRCLVGVLLPESGRVMYKGRDVHANPEIKTNIVLVPDGPSPLQSYTAERLARLYELIYPDFRRDWFAAWLSKLSLPADKPIRTFSKGMQRLLTLVLAFATHAPVVIMDEPVDGLDPIAKRQCLQLVVDEVAARGTTVIISSHRLQDLESVCDRILMLSRETIETSADVAEMEQLYSKFQIVYGQEQLPGELVEAANVHVLSRSGRIVTVLLEGEFTAAVAQIEKTNPLLFDQLPLQLEDVFWAKLGDDNGVH